MDPPLKGAALPALTASSSAAIRKLMGNTKAALPSISSTSRTKNNHRASPKYVFCSTLAHDLSEPPHLPFEGVQGVHPHIDEDSPF
ncbi:MAG: hypothetical protein FRX49_07806 [Trebouxia sp. A1-2]|nr:MAG: hypothetical protein FRX49_07806 [Trebouxia sp. A1-2]